MKVTLIYNARFPVVSYGGTERVIEWLAKGLHELGHHVTLASAKGSSSPYASVVYPDFSQPLEPQLRGAEVFHYFSTPDFLPERPYVVTIGGNGKAGEKFLPNTVFVSRNHATRHGSESYVYNGLDPADYLYREKKNGSLLFLAKASWRVKNVRGAIRLARAARRDLHIVGGRRSWWPRGNRVHWRGMLGGAPKAEIISNASALLFPVLWDEPFGLAVVEAMLSGTPVLASAFGSLPELIAPQAGALCRSEAEFLEKIEAVSDFRAADCRDWAQSKFTYAIMARRYVELYEKVCAGVALNEVPPSAKTSAALYSIPSRTA